MACCFPAAPAQIVYVEPPLFNPGGCVARCAVTCSCVVTDDDVAELRCRVQECNYAAIARGLAALKRLDGLTYTRELVLSARRSLLLSSLETCEPTRCTIRSLLLPLL
jgi:hypothetical protein